MRAATTFQAVRVAGGLLPPGLLERVGREDTSLVAASPADYGLAPGERIGEAITRSWNRLQALWERFSPRLADPAHQTGPTRQEWLLPLFQELGYGQLTTAPGLEVAGKAYPISHLWEATPIHLVGVGVDLSRRTPGAAGAAKVSPHGLVQEYLNRTEEHQWAVLANGRQLRLLRDNASLTRTAFVEFDLEEIFGGDAFAEFAVLWLTCHATRLVPDPEGPVVERWRADSAAQGVRALDALRDGVEEAIERLGSAAVAHPTNLALRQQVDAGELDAQELYRQVLRVVYRFLFLLIAESRSLLLDPAADPTAKARYDNHYALSRLRTLAETVRGGPHGDLWNQHLVVATALHATGAPALGLPSLGGFLWDPDAIGELAHATLPNEALLGAIRSLTTVTPPGGLPQRVDYANLGAEELGSIYESLLEYHPEIDPVAGTFTLSSAAGNERKTTGSYYTPTALIEELLTSALDPVVDEAAAADDPEAAILDLKVVDPAAGSGHFLIAAANRIADRLARVRAGGDEPSPEDLRTALRDVIGRCIYAVDLNPMAVELAKVAMWIEAMEPGKPLTFLDHHIVCGNSLLGVTPKLLEEGVPDAAFKPLTGDDKTHVTNLRKRNKHERTRRLTPLGFGASPADLVAAAADELAAIDRLGDDSVADIAEKQRRYEALVESTEQRYLRLAADAWVAAFVTPKRPGVPEITAGTVNAALHDPTSLPAAVVEHVDDLRGRLRFHHWHLAFPHVFAGSDPDERTGWEGGFDVVLGNPPWERVKLQEKEFFASSAPDIATAPNKAARSRLIRRLQDEQPDLWGAFQEAVQAAEATSHFLRTSGVYPLCGRGDVNTYTVFAEGMRSVLGPAGRVGVIVPTGIATDDTTKYFFNDLVDQQSLVSLFDFENRRKIFPGIDSRIKFCLLTLTGRDRPVAEAEFSFFALAPTDLLDPERRFTLTADDFALLNPNTRTCPIFRTRRDAEITKGIYRRVPVLVDETREDGNPWGITFQRMFDMSNDSHLFRTREQLEADGWTLEGNVFVRGAGQYLPLYEAKMIHHFNHRWATYEHGDFRKTTVEELADPDFVALPRYWVLEEEVTSRLPDPPPSLLLGFRNITNATNERTFVCSAIPLAGAGHSLPLIEAASEHEDALQAVLSSFALDFVARQKLGGTNFTFFNVKQLPIPPPADLLGEAPWDPESTILRWLASRKSLLASGALGLSPMTERSPEYSSDTQDPASSDVARAELDAACFHLWGTPRSDVDHILESFPIVKKNDVARHGVYRTKNLILAMYDRMAQAIDSDESYQTTLTPPPADPSLLRRVGPHGAGP